MKPTARLRSFLCIASSAVLAFSYAHATTLTWDAGGSGGAITNGAGAWLGAGLWNNGGVAATWTSGDDAIFGGPSTAGGAVTLASPTTVNSLTFNTFTGTYTLGTAGQAITLNTGITMNASSGLVTIVSPITLGGSQTWTNNSANKLQINSFVTTSLGQTLSLAGTGEFNFPTSTTGITGGGSIIVDGAYLNLISGGNQAANSYTGTTTVQNGGEIMYYQTGPNIGTGNITLNGGILTGYFNQGFTRAFGTGSNQFQITGGVSGFGVNGTSTINFSNVTSVQWGSVSFDPSKFVLGGGRSGGTVTFAENIDLNNADRTVTTPVGSGGGVLSGVLSTSSGTAGLIKEGAGTLALASTGTNTYNGGTTISQGTLRFDTRLSMPAIGTVTVADGAILGVTVAGTATTWGSGAGVAGIAGLTSTANSGEGFGGQIGSVVNFDGNSFLNLNVTANVTESNDIGNGSATSIRLIKSGASTLTLTGNNSYTGGTTLSAGVLAIGSANALSSGTLFLNGGTIQSNDATARTITNAVTIGGDFTVGGTGELTFSNTGASALGATRIITVNTGRNATFAQAFSGSGAGITKAGAGILTLTGNNTYTGATTINAGTIVLNNDGDVTGSAVTFAGSNTGLTITGGSGVTSIWNAGGGNFGTANSAYNNIQVLIDGAGFAGSARVTNVGILNWGRTATSSTIILTNGGQMNVNGEVRIGNPYYSDAGGANLTIGGGTATSTFTGTAASSDFYIGYGERTGSKNNVVTVSSGGVLTGIRDMVVGHVFDAQNNANPSTNNQLLVTGTGTASMRGISLGFANATSSRTANANIVSVISGGTLTSTGAILIGRANLAGSQSNSNTMTVSGTGSTWNAGNQNVTVGFTNIAGATSNNNILTVGAGGTVTNVAVLTVGSGAGTETGNQLVVNGSLSATTVTVNNGNTLGGSGTITGPVTFNTGSTASFAVTSTGGGANTTPMTITGVMTYNNTEVHLNLPADLPNGTYILGTSSATPVLVGAFPAPVVDSGSYGSGGSGVISLDGNNLVLTVSGGAGGSPYSTWATGGELFNGDANGDGVSNGLAFLLGASGPNVSALDLLPEVDESSGNLVLTFTCLDDASRGTATLYVEHSSDLGLTDPWQASVAVDDDGNVLANGVTLTVTENLGDPDLNDVTATISSSEAASGKLFGRLKAVSAP